MQRLLILPVVFALSFTEYYKIHAKNNEDIYVNCINNIDVDLHEIVLSLCGYLELDSITIIITRLPEQLNNFYKGVTVSDDNGTFIIYLNPSYASSYEQTLVHELIHVKQYKDGSLRYVNDRKYLYEDETIDLDEVKYQDRPFEEDAFKLSKKIIADLKM